MTQHLKTDVTALPFVPDAVIFDMDGLMLDSERLSMQCWVRAARALDLDFPENFWLSFVGQSSMYYRNLLLERIDATQLDVLIDLQQTLYTETVSTGIPLRPGVVELLQWLQQRNIPCGVATSTKRPLAPEKLEAAGLLGYFHSVTAGNDVPTPKPAPDIYLLAAQRLGINPTRCLALEDSPAGVTAALAAGLTVIQVPDLVAPDDALRARDHRIVDSLMQVQQLLEARFIAN